jgi:hypothetical protein
MPSMTLSLRVSLSIMAGARPFFFASSRSFAFSRFRTSAFALRASAMDFSAPDFAPDDKLTRFLDAFFAFCAMATTALSLIVLFPS